MKLYNLILFLFAFGISSFAQVIPANTDLGEQNPYPFITSLLLEVSKSAEKSIEEGINKAESFSMLVRDQSIYVEVVRGDENDLKLSIDEAYLKTISNIEVSNVWKNRASIWIKVNELLTIGSNLPEGYRFSQVIMDEEDNQGPGLMNSDSYNVAGAGGNGMLIAIIDSGFNMLTQARNAGAAPTAANTTTFDYIGGGIESGSRHGTGCLETVFDHAPNAQYYIFRATALADLGTAVTQCINDNVDIISHSQSKYNTGWADDTGAACAAATDASDNGILFFTSSGNRNGTHSQATFSDGNGNDWHNWSGGDEQNDFTMNGTATNTATVRARLQWNSGAVIDHYDLYLYDNNTNAIIQSSVNLVGFEEIIYSTNSNEDVYLAVRAKTANPPEFELFNHDAGCTDFEYASTTSSNTSPSNTTAPNVISVGALPQLSYNSLPGTAGIIAGYSSRGPTNSGNQAPDICAPTNTTTVAYNGAFTGTSCSTPNAAGAAAAFWSGHPFLSASGVRQIMFAKANLYNDWGTPGADNLYGRGGVELYNYHVDNRYILKSAGNILGLPTLPYFSMDSVDDLGIVPSNKIMIYLDLLDNAPGPGLPGLVNKPMLYESIPGTNIN